MSMYDSDVLTNITVFLINQAEDPQMAYQVECLDIVQSLGDIE